MPTPAIFFRTLKAHGFVVTVIKTLGRLLGERVLIEGVDADFPTESAPDLAMPTVSDAGQCHRGYSRCKYVLPLPNQRMMLHIGA